MVDHPLPSLRSGGALHHIKGVVLFSFGGLEVSGVDELPEEDKRWYMHVGFLAENWAGAEAMLDFIVATLHAKYDGDAIEASPPEALNRKIKFVRKVFSRHPDLIAHSGPMNELLEQATELAQIRHWALHGNRVDNSEKTATLSRLVKGDRKKLERVRISTEQLYHAAMDSGGLGIGLHLTSSIAFGRIKAEDLEDLFRQFACKL